MTLKTKQIGHTCDDSYLDMSHAAVQCTVHVGGRIKTLSEAALQLHVSRKDPSWAPSLPSKSCPHLSPPYALPIPSYSLPTPPHPIPYMVKMQGSLWELDGQLAYSLNRQQIWLPIRENGIQDIHLWWKTSSDICLHMYSDITPSDMAKPEMQYKMLFLQKRPLSNMAAK